MGLIEILKRTLKSRNFSENFYCTFYMNEFEFALSGKCFRGLFSIGERKVPLIDLYRMLMPDSDNDHPYEKVALFEIDNMYFGILCHREGTVYSDDKSMNVPVVNVHSLITSIYKVEIQKTLITFGKLKRIAIDVDDIKEIIPYPDEVCESPILPEVLKGYFYFKGEKIYIVDTRVLCDSNEFCHHSKKELLIIKKDHLPYAIMVNSFGYFASYPNDKWVTLKNHPQRKNTQEIFVHSQHGESQTFHLLKPDSIIELIVKK